MIKKYKKIGTLLLGLSCLTGGFFTPVENNSLIPTVQAAENRDKIVCNMTTKELFNVVYGYLREKDLAITFAMPPQSADDYGLIIVCIGYCQAETRERSAFVLGERYFHFYIDKGSSDVYSSLSINYNYKGLNFYSDYVEYPDRRNYSYPREQSMYKLVCILNEEDAENSRKLKEGYYDDIFARVKKESSSAPSRSKER